MIGAPGRDMACRLGKARDGIEGAQEDLAEVEKRRAKRLARLAELRDSLERQLAEAEGKMHDAQQALAQRQQLEAERRRAKEEQDRRERAFQAAEKARRDRLKAQENQDDQYVARDGGPWLVCDELSKREDIEYVGLYDRCAVLRVV